MVEPQIVVLVVAGSSPVDHPISVAKFPIADFKFAGRGSTIAVLNRKLVIGNR